MAMTSAISVVNTSCVRCLVSDLSNIPSRIRRATPISLSQQPPIWDECGELKVHVQPCLSSAASTSAASDNAPRPEDIQSDVGKRNPGPENQFEALRMSTDLGLVA
ncbi:unnamed protein product [Merluccius merluccius]